MNFNWDHSDVAVLRTAVGIIFGGFKIMAFEFHRRTILQQKTPVEYIDALSVQRKLGLVRRNGENPIADSLLLRSELQSQ